jgi:NADH-quinone oxidoreductase subunit M
VSFKVGASGLLVVLAVPLLTAILLAALRPKGRASGWIAGVGAAVPLAGILLMIPSLRQGDAVSLAIPWAPMAGISLDLRVDWLSLPFALTEAGVTLVAVIYAWGYHTPDERTPYMYALLLLFALGMSGTTLADDLFLFFVFWELMLLASCLLILVWGEGDRRGAVAFKYFVVTHLGSLMVLMAFLLLFNEAGSARLTTLREAESLLPAARIPIVIGLLLVGFSVKMAVFPVHIWLPDAHTVAPMPVTIMLAAAMLSMGTYGVLRFTMGLFSFADMAPFALPLMIVGVVSEIYGALMSLAEEDVKRIVAYSSVSQMGYILYGLGTYTEPGIVGATLHVVFHGIVKALLFMVLGLVIRATGKRQLSELGGLGPSLPTVAVCGAVGGLAIAGAPPLCLFVSEWMIFSGGFRTAQTALSVITLFGSLLSVAYALRLMLGIFVGKLKAEVIEARPKAMLASTVALSVTALVAGILPMPLIALISEELSLLMGGVW